MLMTGLTIIVGCRSLVFKFNLVNSTNILKCAFLWDDLDQHQRSRVAGIMVHQRKRKIVSQSGFIGSLDPNHSKGTYKFLTEMLSTLCPGCNAPSGGNSCFYNYQRF